MFSSPRLSGGATLNKDTSILAKSFDIKLLKRELNNSVSSLLLRFKSVLTPAVVGGGGGAGGGGGGGAGAGAVAVAVVGPGADAIVVALLVSGLNCDTGGGPKLPKISARFLVEVRGGGSGGEGVVNKPVGRAGLAELGRLFCDRLCLNESIKEFVC